MADLSNIDQKHLDVIRFLTDPGVDMNALIERLGLNVTLKQTMLLCEPSQLLRPPVAEELRTMHEGLYETGAILSVVERWQENPMLGGNFALNYFVFVNPVCRTSFLSYFMNQAYEEHGYVGIPGSTPEAAFAAELFWNQNPAGPSHFHEYFEVFDGGGDLLGSVVAGCAEYLARLSRQMEADDMARALFSWMKESKEISDTADAFLAYYEDVRVYPMSDNIAVIRNNNSLDDVNKSVDISYITMAHAVAASRLKDQGKIWQQTVLAWISKWASLRLTYKEMDEFVRDYNVIVNEFVQLGKRVGVPFQPLLRAVL